MRTATPKKRDRDRPVATECLDPALLNHPLRRLTRKQAAAFLGVGLNTVRVLEREGKLVPAKKTGAASYYWLKAIEQLSATDHGTRGAELHPRPASVPEPAPAPLDDLAAEVARRIAVLKAGQPRTWATPAGPAKRGQRRVAAGGRAVLTPTP